MASKQQRCNRGTTNEFLSISEVEETQEKPESEALLLRERGWTGDAGRSAPARRVRAHFALGRGNVSGDRLQSVATGRPAPLRGETSSQRSATPAVRGILREVERAVEQVWRWETLRGHSAGVCVEVRAALFL